MTDIRRLSVISLVTLILTAAPAMAEVLVSNLEETQDYPATLGGSGSYDNTTLGIAFTTSSDSWLVDSLDLVVGSATGSPDLTVSLWQTNLDGTIDFTSGAVTSFTRSDADPYSTDLLAVYNFSTSTTTLAADTTYFITVTNNTGTSSSINWGLTASDSYSGYGSLVSGGNACYSAWVDGTENYWFIADYQTPIFAVNGSVVPEPATCAAFMGLGVLGLAIYRRRKGC